MGLRSSSTKSLPSQVDGFEFQKTIVDYLYHNSTKLDSPGVDLIWEALLNTDPFEESNAKTYFHHIYWFASSRLYR